ncbi:MAG TPA: hypothetical protein VGJ18_22545 [Gemmatimonadaceae bacterium]
MLLLRATLSCEASHARHDRLQIGFGPRTLFRTPDPDVPVHLPYTLQHFLDQPPQLRIRSSVMHRLSRR